MVGSIDLALGLVLFCLWGERLVFWLTLLVPVLYGLFNVLLWFIVWVGCLSVCFCAGYDLFVLVCCLLFAVWLFGLGGLT